MSDPLWDNVASLLHFDGDISDVKGHAVTYDHATIETPAIAGGGSLSLEDGQVVIALDAPIGTRDFSVEVLIKPSALPTDYDSVTIFGPHVGGLSAYIDNEDTDTLISVWANGAVIFSDVVDLEVGDTMAIEVSRVSDVFYVFIDGALVIESTFATNLWATSFLLGRGSDAYGEETTVVGLYDEFRLTVDAVRHTEAFTPYYGILPDGAAAFPATVFRVSVIINSSDVTDTVVGDVVIEAEEGSARVADVTIKPAALSPVYIPAWIGKPVSISINFYTGDTVSGSAVLFTGIVDLPSVDLDARVINLRCTDNLQGIVGAISVEDLDTLIEGFYSSAVFDAGASRWGYANDRLSTIPASLDISPIGELRLTEWAAKEEADLVFGATAILDGSLSVDIAERASMVNRIDLEFSYRFPRMKSEGHACIYDALFGIPYGWGGYVNENLAVPTRELVKSAIEASGGSIESITYTALPTSAVIIMGTGGVPAGVWIPNPATDPLLCTGWDAVVSFNYAQDIEETHAITVKTPKSILEIGEIRESMTGALEGQYADTSAAETSVTLFKNDITGIPPADTAPVVVGMTNSVDVTLSPDSDRTAAEAALETLIAVAKTRIASAHRNNRVSAEIPLSGDLDLDKTVAITTPRILAKGKVQRLVHTINSDAGRAISRFDLAISSIAGVGIVHADDPVTAPEGTEAGTTNELEDPIIDFNNGTTEDHTLTITFPGVEDGERLKANPIIASTFDAAITEDIFEVTL